MRIQNLTKRFPTKTFCESLKKSAPLIQPDSDEASAQRFDALMYGIELAYLTGKSYTKGRSDLVKKVRALSKLATIPDVLAQKEMIENILHTDMLERAEINIFEHIRNTLRELMKYIPKREQVLYETHFSDKLLSVEWKESELENDDLQNYKMKVSFYIRQHQDNPAIAKLRGNIPLTVSDIAILEDILWNELGSKEEYEKEYGSKTSWRTCSRNRRDGHTGCQSCFLPLSG